MRVAARGAQPDLPRNILHECAKGAVAPPTVQGYIATMSDVSCVRCGQTRQRIAAPPFRNALGDRIYDSICQTCWKEWLQHQTAVINHYALDLRDPRARGFLTSQTETFLFGEPPA